MQKLLILFLALLLISCDSLSTLNTDEEPPPILTNESFVDYGTHCQVNLNFDKECPDVSYCPDSVGTGTLYKGSTDSSGYISFDVSYASLNTNTNGQKRIYSLMGNERELVTAMDSDGNQSDWYGSDTVMILIAVPMPPPGP